MRVVRRADEPHPGGGAGSRRMAWLVVAATVAVTCAPRGAGRLRDRHLVAPAPQASVHRAVTPRAGGVRSGRDTSTGLAITINIPAYRLDVRDGDSAWSYRVAVGQRRYPTPRGSFRVQEIVWNPWWVPPPSDWARQVSVTPPGPDNPMGRVKMRFVEPVFVHGTPLERSLGSAASHACVRMANADAIALARLVHRRATPQVPEVVLDSALADSARTRRFVVTRLVPVTVRYDVAEVRRDSLLVYPDVYRLGRELRGEAMRALASAGADTLRVDSTALGALLRAGRRRAAAASLSHLLPRAAVAAGTL
jgi:hypothetical protein